MLNFILAAIISFITYWPFNAAALSSCQLAFQADDFAVGEYDHTDLKLIAEIRKAHTIADMSEFEIDRKFDDYVETFHLGDRTSSNLPFDYSLGLSLLRLNSHSHVMDLGAGVMSPLRSISRLKREDVQKYAGYKNRIDNYNDLILAAEKIETLGSPNLSGVTLVDFSQKNFKWGPRDATNSALENVNAIKKDILENSKIMPFIGKYFENIPSKKLIERFGKVDLLLDRSGVLAYTLNLSVTLTKIADVMNTGGEMWMFITRVKVRKGSTILTLNDYIGSLPGFRELRPLSGIGTDTGAHLFVRTSEKFLPPKLKIVSLKASNPNDILYEEIE